MRIAAGERVPPRAAFWLGMTLASLVAGIAAPGPRAQPGTRVEAPSASPAVPSSVSLRAAASSAGALVEGRIRAARVEILKKPRQLVVRSGNVVLKAYRIELGPDPERPKERIGDGRTPEGEYSICEHRDETRYHRALLLAYPNDGDADRGLALGLIDPEERAAIRRAIASQRCPPQDTALGGMILIHGQHPEETAYWLAVGGDPERHELAGLQPGDRDPETPFVRADWTLGCIGLRNQDIRELFDLLPDGTPVTIRRDS